MNTDRPNIDRAMVSLFFEIKRNMPFEQRKDMKISSPTIGQQLISIYQQSNDTSLKQLIEDFMQRAGDGWASKLSSPKRNKPLFTREAIITRINVV